MPKHLLALITAAGVLAACSDTPDNPASDAPPSDHIPVNQVEVDGPVELAPGATVQFTARALDTAGQPIAGHSFTWESDTPTIATVGADGQVTALAAGEVTIYATTGDVTGGIFVTVLDDEQPFVAYVEVAPAGEVELEAGATLQLTATAHASDGSVLFGRELRWETSDAAIATVSASGLVTALAPGAAAIRVICESQRADLTVRVPDVIDPPIAVDHVTLEYSEVYLPVGDTLQLTATPRAADGTPLVRTVTWSSNNPTYVSVSASGLVTALETGGADITATSEGQSVSVRVYADHTATFTLTAVGSTGLPALLGSFTTANENGTTTLSTIRLNDGYLTIDHNLQTYEVVMQGLISSQIQTWVPVPITYESFGSIETDASTGVMTFTPANLGAPFTGRWVPTGVQLQWRPDERLAGATTLLFTE